MPLVSLNQYINDTGTSAEVTEVTVRVLLPNDQQRNGWWQSIGTLILHMSYNDMKSLHVRIVRSLLYCEFERVVSLAHGTSLEILALRMHFRIPILKFRLTGTTVVEGIIPDKLDVYRQSGWREAWQMSFLNRLVRNVL